MVYKLSEINRRVREDPRALVEQGSARYESEICRAADAIQANLEKCPVILLTGPSGSGKTTTAIKIDHELERRGIITHTISMDNYFLDVDPESTPRSEDGTYDFESPLCMDMALLNTHFDAFTRCEEVRIPRFDFTAQARSRTDFTPLRRKPGEAVIFEGIHALNPAITAAHPEATRVYVSPCSDVADDRGELCFLGPWLRLVRRVVRDHRYRGASAAYTLSLWANVRRGEKLYIAPYRETATVRLDTAMPFEVPLFKNYFPQLLDEIPPELPDAEVYRRLLAAFELFEALDPALLPANSLLREFIGGSDYHYHSGVN